MSWLTELSFMDYIIEIIDILLVSYVIYKLFTLIRGTRAVQLLKGMLVIVAGWLLSITFGLNTLSFLMSQAMTYGVLAVMIIFQPELRRALEQLGRGKFFARSNYQDEEKMSGVIEETVKAVQYMAKRRIGALIVFEKETGLGDYIETGIPIDGKLTSELMINIFIPNTPLHDGAVIVRKEKVVAAACYLPLSENPFISKELGTRHRAALGLSELTDSICIIVSEETGNISLSKNGEVHRELTQEELTEKLEVSLVQQTKATSSFWTRGKNNG
ncbi:diadenylate cyclase CdaA [Bacillus horti]|uniref:Diadenylate cyclase n=1 Tax=Caldalkalibacillus horti TaxID=77523 RepID=A0ABT9VYP8_9BACI|nr:diadenylate cyclase CdaA [Bacillus horti]MDQ0166123.1 diadenylate cyclase [Bacillus horti]